MNFDEFTKYVTMMVESRIEGVETRVTAVQKNNGVVLHGLSVCKKDSNIAPNIYLDDAYRRYEDGESLDELVDALINSVQKNLNPPASFGNIADMFNDFELIKDRIYMCVVNAAKNTELLNQVPHLFKDDLAIIFKIFVGSDSNGTATITIRNEHVAIWGGVTADDLYDLALKNMPNLMPAKVMGLNDMLKQMMDLPAEVLDGMFPSDLPVDQQMFVITNKNQTFGAASMFVDGVLDELAEKIGTDLYILPSSVHEVIAISTNMGTPKDLAQMVQQVNGSEVSEEEQLSDNVYRYYAADRKFAIA